MTDFATWNWDLIIKGAGLLGGTVALMQWRTAQEWKRAEYLDEFIAQFEREPSLILACHVLDWTEQRLERPDLPPLHWRSATVMDALRVHADYPSPGIRFTATQVAIRQAIDSLLSFLQRLQTAIGARLVNRECAIDYFKYWLERLATMDKHVGKYEDAPFRMARYIEAYGRPDVVEKLFKRASLALHPQVAKPDMPPPPLETVDSQGRESVASESRGPAIAYNDQHGKDLLRVVRTNLPTNGTGDSYVPADIDALRTYQDAHGLAVDGEIGAATRFALAGDFVSTLDASGVWADRAASATQQAAHYAATVAALGGPHDRVLLAIRGLTLRGARTHATTSSVSYDDAMILLDGGVALELSGATHPCQREAVGGGLPVAMIRPGLYKLVYATSRHLSLLLPSGSGNIPCFRDANGDGVFDAAERLASEQATAGDQVKPGVGQYATEILFHAGPPDEKGSIGCQMAPLRVVEVLATNAQNKGALPYLLADAADVIAARRGLV